MLKSTLKKIKQSTSQCVTVTDLKGHSTLDNEQDACSLNTCLSLTFTRNKSCDMTTRKLLCVLNWAKVIFWLKYSLCERKVKILQNDFVK